ncbi:hypothetical protein LCGC14_0394010 [marine sediment metagenome]|uniref:Uncharacterized protein n=1 Tax=marine sediment metagenome TaxID=412755 RepID=A0A0F9VKM9_9ZZZZ
MGRRVKERFIYCREQKKVVPAGEVKHYRAGIGPAVQIIKPHFNPSLGQYVTSKNDLHRKFEKKGLAPIEDFPHCKEGVHKTVRTKPDIKDAMERARARLKERGEI